MTLIEARLRSLLQDMADEARPVPLLARLEHRAPAVDRRRQLVVAVVAAAVVIVVAASTAVVQARMTSMPQPAHKPVEVLELATTSTTRPGPAWLALTLAGAHHVTGADIPAFLVPADAAAAVVVPPSAARPTPILQRLSADGTRLTRLAQKSADPTPLEVLDLTSGEVLEVALGPVGFAYSAELSPDNESVAVFLDGELRIVDVATGAVTTVHRQPRWSHSYNFARGQGWSPDGRLLAVHDGADLLVMEAASGEVQEVLADVHLANGSQSWAPDGRDVLGYDVRTRTFVVVPVDGSEPRVLEPPDGSVRPLGWAGDRVVWLAGEPGSQRLVTADVDGGDPETWLRFEVGAFPWRA